ncbi:MAG: guanylate kinase [Elusimicrobiota bacterium]|jgi:guanylate kinase|nr:guanylate kinase [Elusimicrobiota bacterium]
MKNQGNIIVLSAPSGAGKTAIYSAVIKKDKNTILSISYTTRKPRKSEKDGVHYFFTDEPNFKKMAAGGCFVEWAKVHNNLYGTPKSFVEKTIKSGKNIILEIDVQGAARIKKHYPKACLIFITVSSLSILKKRLQLRNQDSPQTIAVRMKSAQQELKAKPKFDYVVINENLNEAVNAVLTIIKSLQYRNLAD